MNRLQKLALTLAALATVLHAVPAPAAPTSAKDLYFEQLDLPTEKINTGAKYWIQLRRKGKVSLVDNRTTFYGGDEIRFQVIPNITGYAYVVLAKGSTGKEQILFPNAFETQGRVKAGARYLMPAKGFLKFDSNPGTEDIHLVISRQPLSSAALLDSDTQHRVKIASNAAADQPFKSANCVVAFGKSEGKGIDLESIENKNFSSKGQAETPATVNFAKDLNYVPPAANASRRIHSHRSGRKVAGKNGRATVALVDRPGAVTLINNNPEEALAADIELTHVK